MIIKHANIIYMPTISPLGGIETYVYELVKKYHYLDIAVVSRSCDINQRKRLEKYCKVYIHIDQRIECKVAIINYDQSIINYINKDAKIYQTIHADYTNARYEDKPKDHPRVTKFITITKFLQHRMKDILNTDKIMLSYNPLTIDETDKPLILVSATRLHKYKGKDRMNILAKEMDKAGINYIWYVITEATGGIDSPNVIFIKNRLDVSKWINQADYIVLLSDTEACSYTINEALYRNIPVIVTPLPYLKEIGVEDGKDSYIMEFDCSNVKDIVNRITNVPKFEFKKMEDKYNKIFADSKSKYIPEDEKLFEMQCISNYTDMQLGKDMTINSDTFIVDKERADQLVKAKVCMIVKEIIKEKKSRKDAQVSPQV